MREDSSRLTDECSVIADRLTVAARSWARNDVMQGREPAQEVAMLMDALNALNARRLRIAELEAALRPFADLLSRSWETRGSCHQAVSYDDVARAAALLGSKQS